MVIHPRGTIKVTIVKISNFIVVQVYTLQWCKTQCWFRPDYWSIPTRDSHWKTSLDQEPAKLENEPWFFLFKSVSTACWFLFMSCFRNGSCETYTPTIYINRNSFCVSFTYIRILMRANLESESILFLLVCLYFSLWNMDAF